MRVSIMYVKRVISIMLSVIIGFGIIALPASADEIDTITVHYFNENNWTQPCLYYYYGGNTGNLWPGEAMASEGDGWYSYKIYDYSTAYVIFSDNGSSQNPAQNEQGFQVTGEMWYYKGNWSSEKPENISTTIHYYNESSWSSPYVYYYSDNESPISWPGSPMISEGGNWYTYTIADIANPKVIFSNNGGNQNPPKDNPGFDVTGEKWYLNGTFYDSEPNGITVHYQNYDNWDNVNIYYYNGDKTVSDWTGVPMVSDGDGWFTYKIYGFDSVKVLFNNGEGIQIPGQFEPGFDVVGEMWYRNGEWFNECPNGIKIYFYNPNGWNTPNIYYYLNDNDTGKAWPGEQMKSESDNWYSFTITKYDQAKVMFNSNSNQIPAQNQPGLDAEGVMWYKDGVWCDAESDSDGDGLPDFMEMLLGTDINNADSDGDGLPDGFEYLMIGTDPLKADSDGNGVNDGAEDADGDSLTNLQEYTLGTNPMSSDSDGDGLSDGDEVNIHHTDPLKIDTDGDGLSDYNEITNGFDPLVYNSSFDIELSCEGENVTASVNINGLNGEQAESLQIEPVDNYILLDNRIPGYIDSAFDFSVTGDFETATISFEFDVALLVDENFVPRIYYFNEETQYLEELPNQVVQGNVVSVETTHFSKYILLDKPKLDAVRETDIQPPDNSSQEITGIDVVIAVDTSFNMVSSDPMRKRVSIAKSFVDKLGVNDRAAVGTFDILGIFRQDFTNDHDVLYDVLDVNYYLSECNLSSAMQVINQWFTKESYTRTDAKKCGIIFTDGKGDYSSVHTNMAAENGIEVYTVGLGNHINEELLKAIATGTGGQYFNSSDINTPSLLYNAIRKGVSTGTGGSTVTEDSNNDGISDYYTKLICEGKLPGGTGLNLFAGVSFEALQANDDYDGDGLKNGEEAIISFNEQDNSPYICYVSDPCKKDGDGDGYSDYLEINKYSSNPMINEVKLTRWNEKFFCVYNNDTGKSYGGSQMWFPENDIIRSTGCGLISGSDILLYLSLKNSEYETELTSMIKYDKEGNITLESYMSYIREMEKRYFSLDLGCGVLGPMLEYGVNKYSSDYGLDLISSWVGTEAFKPILFDALNFPKGLPLHLLRVMYQWYQIDHISESNLLTQIKTSLNNDVPLTFSIGPTWTSIIIEMSVELDESAKEELRKELDDVIKIPLYVLEKSDDSPYKFIEKSKTSDHYVTVTGLMVDDISNKIMIEISSWGTRYYIDYNEYINFVNSMDTYVFSSVLNITKG